MITTTTSPNVTSKKPDRKSLAIMNGTQFFINEIKAIDSRKESFYR